MEIVPRLCEKRGTWQVAHFFRARRDFANVFSQLRLAKSLDAVFERRAAFKRAIDNRALANLPIAKFPAERDMHHQVDNEKRLPTFWWSPEHAKADARDNALDEICRSCVEHDLVEGQEFEALMSPRVTAIVPKLAEREIIEIGRIERLISGYCRHCAVPPISSLRSLPLRGVTRKTSLPAAYHWRQHAAAALSLAPLGSISLKM
jgi:hypothetical protein